MKPLCCALFLVLVSVSLSKIVIDNCDLSAISALKGLLKNEVSPLLLKYNMSLANSSFLNRAYNFFGAIPLESKFLLDTSTNTCPICYKNFNSKDYLSLHFSLKHLQNQWPSQKFMKCPADLCSYLPCYKYVKSDPQRTSVLLKRNISCDKEAEIRCAHVFFNSVNHTHINATKFALEAIKTFCLSTICDEEQRKVMYDTTQKTGKSTLIAVGTTIGGLIVFLYYVAICFIYSDQKIAHRKSLRKVK